MRQICETRYVTWVAATRETLVLLESSAVEVLIIKRTEIAMCSQKGPINSGKGI